MKIVVNNAHLIDPANGVDEVTNLYITDDCISHIGTEALDHFGADQVIEAEQRLLIPGLIDLSVYLREPGQEYKAKIATESEAAVSAGITQLCCMPEPDTTIDSMPTVDLIHKISSQQGKARINVIGAMSKELQGKQLTNMGGLKHAGCIAVTNQRQAFTSTYTLRMAMDYAATYDLLAFLHPIDKELTGRGVVHEGAIATRIGLPGIPAAAETVALAQIIHLAEELNIPVHICRLSSAKSVEKIRAAKKRGTRITADVAAHQLFLTEMDISDFNPLCHVQPPFRSQRDLDALRAGVADGTIDAICSDHQPHEIDAKLAPFQQTQPGISALETLLPLVMRLSEETAIPLNQLIASVTHNPAKIIRSLQGDLQIGNQADFTLFDKKDHWQLAIAEFISQGKNTPFAGWSFNGRTAMTFVAGKCVFDRSVK
ncbi:MAG: dihydroorotase [Thiotrichaceae bacterium]|nr:dihydroorotase [Thiotrichaceae bacterium]